MNKIKIVILCLIINTCFINTLTANEVERAEALVLLSSAVLKDISHAPDWKTVSPYMQECVAIGIFPGLKQAGYIVGGQFGRGVIIHKKGNGDWTAPAIYKIKGGSVGFQVGIQEIDLILIFQSEASFRNILKKGYDIGYGLSAAAGPVGRSFQKKHGEDIFAYSRSKGLFAGAAISGAKLSFDFNWSKDYYQDAYNEKMILITDEVETKPESAMNLLATINKFMK